jgi:hypothetical protein
VAPKSNAVPVSNSRISAAVLEDGCSGALLASRCRAVVNSRITEPIVRVVSCGMMSSGFV